MIKTVVMPKLGTTMREGVLTDWHKKVGDYVTAGEVLLSVESNKANVEVESVLTGYLVAILCPPGETRSVNEVVGLIADTPGEDVAPFLAELAEGKTPCHSAVAPSATVPPPVTPTENAPPPILPRAGEVNADLNGKIRALPKARAMAKKLGIDLSTVVGTGRDGMITVADVENAQNAGTVGVQPTVPSAESTEGTGVFRASPLAKKIAAAERIDLSAIRGTGPGGKIMKGDLPFDTRPSVAAMDDAIRRQQSTTRPDSPFVAEATAGPKIPPNTASNTPPQAVSTGDRRATMSPMRRAIAENMAASLVRSAQACHRLSIDMTRVKEIRAAYIAKGMQVSFNDILVAAVALALVEHPNINASSDGNDILFHADVNVGLAVALDEGLIVPNIKGAQNLMIPEIAERSRVLIEKAKSGTLTPDDYKGGTFTVTNLGMFDIEDFVAILNPPEAGILAVGKIMDKPVVVGGEIVIRPMMTACLTYDHRVIDGAPAAAFLRRIKGLLEDPLPLIIHESTSENKGK